MNMDILKLIGRENELFTEDIQQNEKELYEKVSKSRFLVIGGAGSIGQVVTKEIFKRNPRKLHIVDISENNLVELVRDIRSSFGYIDGDFQTFALDIGSAEYDAFWNNDGKYDYVLNLSALKHVRSEKDPFTISGTGKQVRDVLHNTDVVNLYFAAKDITEAYGQAFNIGGGIDNSLSLLELFSLLEEMLHIKMNYRQIEWHESDQKIFVADNKKIKKYINWNIEIDPKIGIKQSLQML